MRPQISSRTFVLTLSMCANVYFAFLLHNVKTVDVRIKEQVAAKLPAVVKDSFSVGCQYAVQGLVRKGPDETDYPLYMDWCEHNATAYSAMKK